MGWGKVRLEIPLGLTPLLLSSESTYECYGSMETSNQLMGFFLSWFDYGIGKIAAQCSHATLACYKYYVSKSPSSPILKRWERGGQAKVVLQVRTEEELLLLQGQALSLGLCARVIQDAGRTQIASGSRTVLGILGPKSVVDSVTGDLKLL